MTPERLGIELARACRWDIEALGIALTAALVESNFHALATKLDQLIEIEKGKE
jgi:hypothetical protein